MPERTLKPGRTGFGARTALVAPDPGESGVAVDQPPTERVEGPARPTAVRPRGGADRAEAVPSAPARLRSETDQSFNLDEESEEVVRGPKPEVDIFAGFQVVARVVYLGQHPHMQVYLNGAVEEVEDESGQKRFRAVSNRDFGMTYNFNRLDSKGRPIRQRMTKDGKMFHLCMHIGHLVQFEAMRDADGQPLFEIRATPEVREQIEAYLARLRELRGRDTERGLPVLKQMGLA